MKSRQALVVQAQLSEIFIREKTAFLASSLYRRCSPDHEVAPQRFEELNPAEILIPATTSTLAYLR